MDAEIAVTHPGSPISQITYRLASSPPFVIAMVGHRGVNNGVFSAERGYEGTDPTQWWALEPRVLSRWIHGKTYLSDEHIYSTEVQIELFAMPFDTSEEVIRCLCYVLGVKPHDLKRRRNSPSPHSEYDARVTAGQDHGAEL